ncbi:MAG TPA: cation:proton antiporter [Spirochaetota bacterium]|nr:cation:proton antiporter [Spirochaetota bacterium]
MDVILHYLITLRDTFNNHIIFTIGILLLTGYLCGKLFSRLRLPEITGYIFAGLFLGDAFSGIIHPRMNESLKIVTDVALGLIALTIGSEFYLGKLKRLGKNIIIITLIQLLAAFVIVTAGLFLFGMKLPFALLLGAIASATAPAATVVIVQTLRARGLFVDYLYGVVALDDAGCVLLFSVVFAFAAGLIDQSAAVVSKNILIMQALGEVFFSVLLGLVSGLLLHIFTNKKNNNNEIMLLALGIIFFTIAVAITLHLSPLITNMTSGCLLINLSVRNHRLFRILEPLTPPIYALFFIIAGTELQPQVFLDHNVLLLGFIYILLRALGKYGGVYLGCRLSGLPSRLKHYLGLCMLPQAGVAIGLVLFIQAAPAVKALDQQNMKIIIDIVNIVLISVFINELAGPPLARYAIIKGNEMEE